jgi:SAM-dependent methyltransferase
VKRTLREKDLRTPEQIRHHYEVETELADRLRFATRAQRRSLYGSVYNELYQRVPDHPQLTRKASAELTRDSVGLQLQLLQPFLQPQTTLLEIGPGDCALAIAVAAQVRRVYGIDVSEQITEGISFPPNFRRILSDGIGVPLPPDSVDVAYSNQVMEHVHPDDALEHLAGIWRALRPGGLYICLTPNRLNGPHDISNHFDHVATGFHLKEYTVGELTAMFRAVGFRKVATLLGRRGALVRRPVAPVTLLESALRLMPPAAQRMLALTRPCRAFLGVRLIGTK